MAMEETFEAELLDRSQYRRDAIIANDFPEYPLDRPEPEPGGIYDPGFTINLQIPPDPSASSTFTITPKPESSIAEELIVGPPSDAARNISSLGVEGLNTALDFNIPTGVTIEREVDGEMVEEGPSTTPRKMIKEFFGVDVDLPDPQKSDLFIPKSEDGKVAAVRALLGFAIGGGAIKGLTKLGPGATGALADFAVLDRDENLSDAIQQLGPEFQNSVTDFLANKTQESEFRKATNQALEGFGLGHAVEGVVNVIKNLKGLGETGAIDLNKILKGRGLETAEGLGAKRKVMGVEEPDLPQFIIDRAKQQGKTPIGREVDIFDRLSVNWDKLEKESDLRQLEKATRSMLKEFIAQEAGGKRTLDAAATQAAKELQAGPEKVLDQIIALDPKKTPIRDVDVLTSRFLTASAVRNLRKNIDNVIKGVPESEGQLASNLMILGKLVAKKQQFSKFASNLLGVHRVSVPEIIEKFNEVGAKGATKQDLAIRDLVEFDNLSADLIEDVASATGDVDSALEVSRSVRAEIERAKKLVKKIKKENKKSGKAQSKSQREISAEAGRKIRELQALAQEGDIDAAEELVEALESHKAVTDEWLEKNRLAAQKRAEKPEPEPETLTDEAFAKKALEMYQSMAPGSSPRRVAIALSTLPPERIEAFAKEVAKRPSIFYELWYNGILSGPQTQIVNIASNTLVSFWTAGERYLAAGLGTIRRAAGDPRGEISFGEANAMLFGMMRGYTRAISAGSKNLWKIAKLQDVDTSGLNKLEQANEAAITAERFGLKENTFAGSAIDKLGHMIRTPSKLLMTMDEFFKAVGYDMELNALAYREVRKKVEAGELVRGSQDEANLMADLLSGVNGELVSKATHQAHVLTFTNELGEAGQWLMNARNKLPLARVVVPFMRTPTNLMKYQGVRAGPIALLSKNVRDDIAKGGADAELAIARMTSGSMLAASAMFMAANGWITGAAPENEAMRATLKASGWQPYSFVFTREDGTKDYVSFNRADPMGAFFGIVADMSQFFGNGTLEEEEQLSAALIFALSNNVLSKTWFKGVTDVIASIEHQDAGKFAERFAGSLIPNIAATAERAISPEATSTEGLPRDLDPDLNIVRRMLVKMQSRIPGWSDSAGKPQLGIWGQPVIYGHGISPLIANPFWWSTQKPDPVTDEMIKEKPRVGLPGDNIMGVKLTPEEFHFYSKERGESARLRVEQTIKGFAYKSALGVDHIKRTFRGDIKTKAKLIEDQFRDATAYAQDKTREEFPELEARIQALLSYEEQRVKKEELQ